MTDQNESPAQREPAAWRWRWKSGSDRDREWEMWTYRTEQPAPNDQQVIEPLYTADHAEGAYASPTIAHHCTDARYPYIHGIVTTSKDTVEAWRESGIEFEELVPRRQSPAASANHADALTELANTARGAVAHVGLANYAEREAEAKKWISEKLDELLARSSQPVCSEMRRCMDMLGDVPGDTLEARLTKLQGWYMEMQILCGNLKHRLEVSEAVNRLSSLPSTNRQTEAE